MMLLLITRNLTLLFSMALFPLTGLAGCARMNSSHTTTPVTSPGPAGPTPDQSSNGVPLSKPDMGLHQGTSSPSVPEAHNPVPPFASDAALSPVAPLNHEAPSLAAAPPKEGAIDQPAGGLETEDYRIGEEDELAISVYGEPDLTKTQIVRPGGRITFPLIDDINAAGLAPKDLGLQIARRLAPYIKDPHVTVIITKYNSRKVTVLGQVKTPGLLRLSSDVSVLEAISLAGGLTEDADLQGALLLRDGHIYPLDFFKLFKQGDTTQNVVLHSRDTILIPNRNDTRILVLGQVTKPLTLPLTPGLTLIESISRAGGLTEDADLQGALFIRDGHVQPVDFEKLIQKGDFSQNVTLKPNDAIIIPNIKDKKAFVLGEVTTPRVVTLRPGLTVLESISIAGGFTSSAQKRNIVVVRGGLGDPKLLTVNADTITGQANTANNIALAPGDIVYVPKTVMASVVKFMQDITQILAPFVLAEAGIVQGPAMELVLTGRATATSPASQVPVVVGH